VKPDLAAFLARHAPRTEEMAIWGGGTMPLRVTGYLTQEQPRAAYVTSVRSLVFRDGCILVMQNPDGMHLMPGGRREPGEDLMETLRREVLEETGWTLHDRAVLGFLHYRHLGPRLPSYRFPYPDFLQVIYVARADAYFPEARQPDDYEDKAEFLPIAAADSLDLSPIQRLYLAAALGMDDS
jgi:8-oxo-dGTP pyrophosphatase MutT (NUDIX family)